MEKPHNNCSNLPPYGSPEWHARNTEEIAARPTAILKRVPFDWDAHKPKPVPPLTVVEHTFRTLEHAGLAPAAAQLVATLLAEQAASIEALERTLQVNPAQAGVEKRSS